MSTQYSFDVISLDVMEENEGLSDVVKTVVLRYIATNSSNVSCYVDVGIRLNAPSEDFISFENLTKNDVFSWVQTSILDFDEKIKFELDRKLEKLSSSITNISPPWNS